ncbi:restriction endonuclease subunit S [Haemophilus parahaemolyticus]|uniref:restriction endonuclease subunit S n=1 Tax=Haemophilus parahaemolyticus TaxID=735 RepID=UPI000DAD48AC|nr:restriction endonuclease subunit S [Haemophilus parahaemolyticus]RDE80578.1 restriction endonuclease subunit S [Haemophilus parahaemolyticus]
MKHKLGDLIEIIDEKNTNGEIKDFYGININKEFMPTVANTDNLEPKKYKVLRKGWFLFSGAQTGRDICIRLGLYENKNPVIVSPSYTIFKLKDNKVLLPEYLFMLFLRKEMDRYGWFLSDSSIRSNLDWDRFCNIELSLPSLEIQQKYVAVYQAMLANQRAYEKGLEDLKLVCDAYIEHLQHSEPLHRIGDFIAEHKVKNNGLLDQNSVMGIATAKTFIETKSNLEGVNLDNYLIVPSRYFAYVADTSRRGDKISLAFNESKNNYLVSSISTVFYSKNETKLLPEYLALFFNRSEFDRYARFHSWGSAREVFSWTDLCEVKIPLPDLNVQQFIVDIYKVLLERRRINEQLKNQIKQLCPVLVRGAMAEI